MTSLHRGGSKSRMGSGPLWRHTQMTEQCEHPESYPDEPKAYIAWHEWADEKAKTHEQKHCPYCKLWAIWEPKG